MPAQNRTRAFSLIELMVVLVMVGILAAVAIPAYRDYVTRAKVAESFALVEPFKTEVVQYYQDSQTLPCCNDGSGVLGASGYTGPVTVYNPTKEINYIKYYGYNTGLASIEVWFNSGYSLSAFGVNTAAAFTIQAVVTGNQLAWTCGLYQAAGSSVPSKYLPSTCQATTRNS